MHGKPLTHNIVSIHLTAAKVPSHLAIPPLYLLSSNEFKLFPRNLKTGQHRIQSLKIVRNPHTFSDVIVGNKVAVRLFKRNAEQHPPSFLSVTFPLR